MNATEKVKTHEKRPGFCGRPCGPWVAADAMCWFHAIISGIHYAVETSGIGSQARCMADDVRIGGYDSTEEAIAACEGHAHALTGRVEYGDASAHRATGGQRIVG